MMMLANIISGISAILSTILVGKLGAIKTMVITHVSVFINTKKFTCFIFRFHQIYFYC
jgi:hypothetical protein